MSLVTRCASCGTAFRVQPTQLSARAGQVRSFRIVKLDAAAKKIEVEMA